jgi:hypothetical protein
MRRPTARSPRIEEPPYRREVLLMGGEFWRTVQKAIDEDNRTVRLIVILFTMGAMALIAYLLISR